MENPIRIHAQVVGGKAFGEPATDKKGAALYGSLGKYQSFSIRQISKNRAELVGYYRFLENKNVTVGELVRSHQTTAYLS